MPETTIDFGQDGEIQISQKDEQLGDLIICFPVELAEKIANEVLRLARDYQSK
jgi:hypothetical protein